MVPKRPRREDQLVPRLQPSMSMVPHVQGIDLMPAIRGVHEHMSTWMRSLINAQDGCLQAVCSTSLYGQVSPRASCTSSSIENYYAVSY